MENESKKTQPTKKEVEDSLSDEDRVLKENLELLVARVCEVTKSDDEIVIQKNALEALRKEIRSSTTSMTSVPKPLKFLRPHYPKMKQFYLESIPANHSNKPQFADVLSILAMTLGNDEERDSLRFRMEGAKESVGSYGHEYVRNLAGEVTREFAARREAGRDTSDLSVMRRSLYLFLILLF